MGTHTYALLPVSPATYDEIHAKLTEGGYGHAFHQVGDGTVIDMHGLALTKDSINKKGTDAAPSQQR